MNEALAIVIALLLYPGMLFALVAALLLGWLRGNIRAVLHGWEGSAPLVAPREFNRRLRQSSTVPAGTHSAILQALPLFALIAPILVLVFLPLPGNRAIQDTYGIDIAAAGAFLLGMPLARIALGWIIPSPYTRLAAMRSARRLLGYLAPLILALTVAAVLGGGSRVSVLMNGTFPNAIHQPIYATAARIVAALAYAIALPALTRLTPLRDGQGPLDLVGSELTELSGRELLIMRLAEWVQLVAALGLGIVVFILPFFHTDLARGLVALGSALLGAVLLGLWEGIAPQITLRDEIPLPYAIWLSTPTLAGIFAVLLLIFAQRS